MPNPFKPLTTLPSRTAKRIADTIDDPMSSDRSRLKGFLAGSIEGVGDLADDMTSPFGIAASALGPTAAGLSRLLKGAKRTIPAITGTGRSARAMEQLGPEFLPKGADALEAFNSMRRTRMAEEAARLRKVAEAGDTGMIPKRIPIPDETPMNPTLDAIARALESVKRQGMINAARERPARARRFRSNTPED